MIKWSLLRKLPIFAEIFEFDAMDDPPSVLDVDVYDFDGPFDEVASLGHAEINFLKTNISDLADIWISLEGKLALACQSKFHLRIFLDNTRGGNVVRHYLSKMEKEVGKKVWVHLCYQPIGCFFFVVFYFGIITLFWFIYFSYLQNCRLIYGLPKRIQPFRNSLGFHLRNFSSMTSPVI